MDFLIQIDIHLPPEMPAEQREQLLGAERERGEELRRSGVIYRIWRVPGRLANVAIWRAEDATALHQALDSLPLLPWADVRVQALARHPLENDQTPA